MMREVTCDPYVLLVLVHIKDGSTLNVGSSILVYFIFTQHSNSLHYYLFLCRVTLVNRILELVTVLYPRTYPLRYEFG